MTKEVLQGLISRRWSSYKIAEELVCSPSTVRRWLKEYDLKTICRSGPKSDVQRGSCAYCGKQLNEINRSYCGQKCHKAHQYSQQIELWKAGKIDGKSGWGVGNSIRRYLTEKYGNKCSRCGWCVVNLHTKKVPLQVDHIDGNYKNNKEENLTLLCPNCHCLTPTWGGRNRGKGRPRYATSAPRSCLF